MAFPRVIYKKVAKPNSWCRWATFRVQKRNNSTNLRFVGDTGCQPKGSKVLMANGLWKNIEEIKIGDEVLSPQENGSIIYSKITNITKWMCKENYDIYQMNKEKKKLYSCSFNHLVPFLKRVIPRKNGIRYKENARWEYSQKTAEEYSKYSNNGLSHRQIGFSSFLINKFKNRKNCELEPYTLGVYLGDGYSRKKDMNITSCDFEIIKEISKFYPIMSIRNKQGTTAKSYAFSMKGNLAKQLKKNNLIGEKSGTKFIPKDALLSDVGYRKKLLAGLIDTDGYYSPKSGGYAFTLKSKQLIEDIKNLVYSLGGRCGKINKVQKSIKKINFTGTYYNLNFYLGDMKLPLKLKRKKRDISTIYLDSNRIAIKAVKNNKKEMVYGFSLDSPSKWYITDNWMVTHNTGKSWSAVATAEIMAKMMKKKFTVDNIYFSIREVLDEISENDPKPGTIFLIDEQQVEAGAESHQSKRAKAYTLLLSTVRSKRYIIITTLPFSDMELRKVRRFFHVEVETRGANLSTNTVKGVPRYLEYSRLKKDKVYRKRLVVSFVEEATGIRKARKLDKWDIPKPSQELVDSYELKKKIFQKQLYKRLSAELKKEEGGDDENDKAPKAGIAEHLEQSLTEYQRGIFKHLKAGVKKYKDISVLLEKEGFNSNPVKLSQNIKWMKKKGVVILK